MGIMPSSSHRFEDNPLHAARLNPHANSQDVGFIGYHHYQRYKIEINVNDPGHTIKTKEELEGFMEPLLQAFP